MAGVDRVVVVTKPTDLDLLLERFGARGAVEFFLASRGQSIAGLEAAADRYRRAVDAVLASLPDVPRAVIARAELPHFLFRARDIVLAVGPDGLVVNAGKYLDGQPIAGVNPDPTSIAGTLAAFVPPQAGGIVAAAMRGLHSVPLHGITLAEARLNDGRVLLAVNDFLVGRLDQVSARYRIEVGGAAESQSSSGVLVSTPLGGNAWLRSVRLGASAICAAQVREELQEPARLASVLQAIAGAGELDRPWSDPELVYAVREPFPSPSTGTSLVFGRIAPGTSLRIESQMSEGGAIVSDGVVEDFASFNAGAAVVLAASERKLHLVTPGWRPRSRA